MNRREVVLFVALAAALTACERDRQTGLARASAAASAAESLLIMSEDVLTVHRGPLALGPSITGSVQPERRADLRAEISAVVLEVLKDNGDPVRRGDVLVRLDDTAIRDGLSAAEASARAAEQTYSQAERQFQRVSKLRESAVVSLQDAEDVEIRRNNAKSDLEAAKTRVVSARQQLQRTEVRAPFDGVVSDRKVSGGDTAQIGKELIKVIDPHSMRFEGGVSADSIGEVAAGQKVVFRVHGYAQQSFEGTVTRINPAASAATRQAEVLVAFKDAAQQPKLAGLYAEGRIEIARDSVLTLPPTAIVREDARSYVWRLEDRVIHKVAVTLGEQSTRTGEFVLRDGLNDGDKVLRYPTSALKDGQKVELEATTAQPMGLPEAASAPPGAGNAP